jgi:hypothetical protein
MGRWAEFARLRARVGHRKALVAIARRLLVVVWHVLTHETVDRHAIHRTLRYFIIHHNAGHEESSQ